MCDGRRWVRVAQLMPRVFRFPNTSLSAITLIIPRIRRITPGNPTQAKVYDMTPADAKNLRAVKGMYVRITWRNGADDWPYFRLLSISRRVSMIKLRVLGSPDGSSKHAGDEYWMDWRDVESIVPVVVGAC
jgi:hypothetical protein